ncbi:MAG: RNA-binding S4 domain-containing protein [Desulfobulbaceae bacterium]|nr:RNA-binding S4 domain-containing protein [Desulfobulbaceae bacterium]
MDTNIEAIRLDKWLWAARFFKTRSMAGQAIKGGKVHVNGNRAKAARNVLVGDRLSITIGFMEFDVRVLALARFRRPAKEAKLLYVESDESIKTRQEQRDLRRMANAGYAGPVKKPTKRDRRKIKSFTRRDEQE